MADTSPTTVEQNNLRQQITESRGALAEKLELLEGKVTESVQSATASVSEATASVVETVQNATASVSETVGSVNSAVQGTVENVKNTMSDTVQSIKDSFDLTEQVRRHPWSTLAGAVVVGFVASRLIHVDERRSRDSSWDDDGPHHAGWTEYNPAAWSAQREAQRAGYDTASSARNTESGSTANRFANATAAADAQPSWMDQLRHTFKGELEKVQGLAIGASLALIRDFVSQSAPPPLKNHITEILNDVTAKLGGKTISEPFLSSSQDHNPAV